MSGPLGLLLALVAAGATSVSGVVYDDTNANGRRDAGEPGLSGVAVSDGAELVAIAADGGYRLTATGRSLVPTTNPVYGNRLYGELLGPPSTRSTAGECTS